MSLTIPILIALESAIYAVLYEDIQRPQNAPKLAPGTHRLPHHRTAGSGLVAQFHGQLALRYRVPYVHDDLGGNQLP